MTRPQAAEQPVFEETMTATEARPMHVLTADQFERAQIESLIQRALELGDLRDQAFAGKIMATLFFEPSTRTRLSFESAMVRRAGTVIGSEAAGAFSSAAKGESIEDTIRVVSSYADVIVLRHPEVNADERAAAVSSVPIINAGDGSGEHPTQALLDLLTIQRELGAIDGKHLLLCGDLQHARTTHSIAVLAARFDVRITCVSPQTLAMPRAVVEAVSARGVAIGETENIFDVVGDCDVLYQTRIQRERFTDTNQAAQGAPIVDTALMSKLRSDAIVMQPLPRVDDITRDVDADPRAAYFRQAANGVAMRMALLEWVLS